MRLHNLCADFDLDEKRRHVNFSLPLCEKKIGGERYFQFPLFNFPMNIRTAKKDIVAFVEKVVVAVDALHKFGLAHLDIRIDNICFTTESNIEERRAVLIDLDIVIPKEIADSCIQL